jgi:hypothetical protein
MAQGMKMPDTSRNDIELEFSGRFWTLTNTFVLTDEQGRDIYKSESRVTFDRKGLHEAHRLISGALATQ